MRPLSHEHESVYCFSSEQHAEDRQLGIGCGRSGFHKDPVRKVRQEVCQYDLEKASVVEIYGSEHKPDHEGIPHLDPDADEIHSDDVGEMDGGKQK